METEDHENRKLNKSGETSNLEKSSSDCGQELMAELTVFSREKELAKVTIKKEDVELIVSFFYFPVSVVQPCLQKRIEKHLLKAFQVIILATSL